ncbi:hypothetical protein PIB30_057878 [Stylosanthes scabra]|uniref:Uncharacterized protein n=1 Tax=Stylosanthes scabra TaxID=79078 RepID=A0ABU6SL31_9FABA|nr:hypothetical protein [Stylosanthes scabra]
MLRGRTRSDLLSVLFRKTTTSGGHWMLALLTAQPGRFLAPWCRSSSSEQLNTSPIGIEKAFASKVQMEKELASLKDQVDVLTVERDSALAAPLLNAEIKSLTLRLQFS